MNDPDRHRWTAQFRGSPQRRFYAGADLRRVRTLEDLRARAHRLMPGFVLEYLEGGAEDEATLRRERDAFAEWRFVPRQLRDVSLRSLEGPLLGRNAPMPLAVAPTGLNALFRRHGDLLLARGAARAGVPFVQSTMSNDRMEEVASVPGLRHWWQLYVFGPDEIWQELVRRAGDCGCEALVLTTNAVVFGNREWEERTRGPRGLPTPATVLDAWRHPRWLLSTLARGGLPVFANVVDFLPKDKRGFFEIAGWIREQMRESLSWDDVARIRQRWRGPFLLKGLLHPEDVARAAGSGVDGVILETHGGRQADWSVSALDVLPRAREIVGAGMALMIAGGIRRGTDVLKALALGADAVLAGRAPLYGLCAAGEDGVARALDILRREAVDAMGQLGVASRSELTPELLVSMPGAVRPGGQPAG